MSGVPLVLTLTLPAVVMLLLVTTPLPVMLEKDCELPLMFKVPLSINAVPLVKAPAEPAVKVPEEIVVAPLYVSVPDKVKLPVPDIVNPNLPVIEPA